MTSCYQFITAEAGHHAIAPDELSDAHEPIGDDLRMFDVVALRIDDAEDDPHLVG